MRVRAPRRSHPAPGRQHEKRDEPVIYEIREYTPMPGRLDDVMGLFRTTLIPLFRRHEMELVHVGFTTIGDRSFNELVYTMRFADLAEMDRKWKAFIADPDFGAALGARETSGPLYQAIKRRVTDAGPFDDILNG